MKLLSAPWIGVTLAVIGGALLVLNAVDYLAGWDRTGSAIAASGLMLAMIGAGLARRGRASGPDQPTT